MEPGYMSRDNCHLSPDTSWDQQYPAVSAAAAHEQLSCRTPIYMNSNGDMGYKINHKYYLTSGRSEVLCT